jgi:ribosomal protein S27E
MGMEKASVVKKISPEKYGMIFCPDCHGSGKSFDHTKGVAVCKVCGGFGAIRKEGKDTFFNNYVPVQ